MRRHGPPVRRPGGRTSAKLRRTTSRSRERRYEPFDGDRSGGGESARETSPSGAFCGDDGRVVVGLYHLPSPQVEGLVQSCSKKNDYGHVVRPHDQGYQRSHGARVFLASGPHQVRTERPGAHRTAERRREGTYPAVLPRQTDVGQDDVDQQQCQPGHQEGDDRLERCPARSRDC